MEWIDLGNGRQVLRGSAPVYTPRRKRDSHMGFEPHISSSLPRNCKFHKGAFVKSGPEKGKPIIASRSEVDHITKASHGKYEFDYRNDRARPFQLGDGYERRDL